MIILCLNNVIVKGNNKIIIELIKNNDLFEKISIKSIAK